MPRIKNGGPQRVTKHGLGREKRGDRANSECCGPKSQFYFNCIILMGTFQTATTESKSSAPINETQKRGLLQKSLGSLFPHANYSRNGIEPAKMTQVATRFHKATSKKWLFGL